MSEYGHNISSEMNGKNKSFHSFIQLCMKGIFKVRSKKGNRKKSPYQKGSTKYSLVGYERQKGK